MEEKKQIALMDSLVQELRRGTKILSVMSQVKTPQYGYSLVVLLQEKGVNIDANTLYPLLRRLESQGILQSSWDVESAKPRKYYQLSSTGETIYEKLKINWFQMSETMNKLLDE